MREIEESDYKIIIGIKNNKINKIDWKEMILKGDDIYFDYKKEIIKKLKQAIKFIKRK